MSLAEIYNIEEENDFSKKTQKKLDLLMGTAWPIPHALQHFLSILFCIIMMIVNVFTYIINDYVFIANTKNIYRRSTSNN